MSHHSPVEVAPLISITSETWSAGKSSPDSDSSSDDQELIQQREEIGKSVVKALQSSGFLLVQSDFISQELQQQALKDAEMWIVNSSTNADDGRVTQHPTDPKSYVMLDSSSYHQAAAGNNIPNFSTTLQEYWNKCEQLKACILRAIGVGLELEHSDVLVDWHSKGQNSAMRLLHYPPITTTDNTGNRCKEHSDYGCLTLLSTDGVSGLEIHLDGKWWPIPHVPGTIVVNIGSLLSDWTDQQLLATLHRVAGPSSEYSASNPEDLKRAVSQGRTSIAFFVDPDNGAPLMRGGSIQEYIKWRSGGSGPDRSGVAFTSSEHERVVQEQETK